MYKKFKFLILGLLIAGAGMSAFTYFEWLDLFYYEHLISAVLVIGLVLFFFLPRTWKTNNDLLKLTFVGIGFFLIGLNVHLIGSYFQITDNYKTIAEYKNTSCEEMGTKFNSDKKSGNIKFFHFNTFYVESMEDHLREYDIEYFGMGSLVDTNLKCYNELVKNYLIEEKNMNVYSLYE